MSRPVVELRAFLFALYDDWRASIEHGCPQRRAAAVARLEYSLAELLNNPTTAVVELICPSRLIPAWEDLCLFPGPGIEAAADGGAWRPSKAADAASCRLLAQQRAEREYGTPADDPRDCLGPLIAEWQAAHA